MPRLDGRAEAVLNTIISEYLATGEPVGSRTVSKASGMGLSAASIRNVMSDLTDLGFITQPHVSAGRIPTDTAYRIYVDGILAGGTPGDEDYAAIEDILRSAGMDVRDMLRQSSSILAGLSKQAGVVTPVSKEQTCKTVEFIKVAEDKILVVLVSTAGLIQNKIIFDEDGVDQDTLERYGRMVTDLLRDLDLREAKDRIERELATEKVVMDSLLGKTLRLSRRVLSQGADREIFIEGQANILDEPEFGRVEMLKALLITFEEKSRLVKILDKTIDADGVQIFIGSEHGLDEIESCSIIAYPIHTGDTVVASIGVIGPKRMNYRRMVSVVDTTGRVLTRLLRDFVEKAV